jgi:hypothetical protein
VVAPRSLGSPALVRRPASAIKGDEVFQVAQGRVLAAQVELHPAADREQDLALLVAEPDSGDDREPALDAQPKNWNPLTP